MEASGKRAYADPGLSCMIQGMALPDPLTSKATEPAGIGRTVRCLVVKDGKRFEVSAVRRRHDAQTDAVDFPVHLYENGGFTLMGIEGEPDYESLSKN